MIREGMPTEAQVVVKDGIGNQKDVHRNHHRHHRLRMNWKGTTMQIMDRDMIREGMDTENQVVVGDGIQNQKDVHRNLRRHHRLRMHRNWKVITMQIMDRDMIREETVVVKEENRSQRTTA